MTSSRALRMLLLSGATVNEADMPGMASPARSLRDSIGDADVRRRRARLWLAGLAVLLVAGLWRPLPRHGVEIPVERTDNALFDATIERLAQGESYYSAIGTEMRARGYPTASIFNWRQPTLFIALAMAPLVMRVLLIGLVIWVIAWTVGLFSRARSEILLLAVLAQVGAATTALTPLGGLLPETWAGICLALSALAYARGRPSLGTGFGLAGLFVRELLVLYVAVCVFLAVRQRRWRELAVWVAGGSAWVVFYVIHATAATHAMHAGDLAHPSWVQLGGLRFVLATIGFGGWLYLMPPWVAAIGCVLLVASVWAPVKAAHVRGAVVAYLMFFAVVGQPFNQSWGLLTASVWAIAYGLGVQGLLRLIKQAIDGSLGVRA